MSDHLARTVAEVARRLAGEAMEGDGGTVVAGRIGERAVLVDLFDSATLSIRLQYASLRTFVILPGSLFAGFLSFRRRVRSGEAAFDDFFRVEHESGLPPDDLLASGAFRATVTALAPFEEISFGNGIVRFVTLYDSESLIPDEVLERVASVAALAVAAEAVASSRA